MQIEANGTTSTWGCDQYFAPNEFGRHIDCRDESQCSVQQQKIRRTILEKVTKDLDPTKLPGEQQAADWDNLSKQAFVDKLERLIPSCGNEEGISTPLSF